MIFLIFGAIGYLVAGFMGVAIGVIIACVTEFVWRVIR